MEKYSRLVEAGNKATRLTTTLEFYVKGGKLWVRYNGSEMIYQVFLKKTVAKPLLDILYNYLMKEYPILFRDTDPKKKDTALVNFILDYFNKDKAPHDVLILDSGKLQVVLEV